MGLRSAAAIRGQLAGERILRRSVAMRAIRQFRFVPKVVHFHATPIFRVTRSRFSSPSKYGVLQTAVIKRKVEGTEEYPLDHDVC
jgi:hypothetical protein